MSDSARPEQTHVHSDECWEPGSGCDMGRNEKYVEEAPRYSWHWRFEPEEWALPIYVRWVRDGNVWFFAIHILCFSVCYEEWLI